MKIDLVAVETLGGRQIKIEAYDEKGSRYDFGSALISFNRVNFRFAGEDAWRSDVFENQKAAVKYAKKVILKNVDFSRYK